MSLGGDPLRASLLGAVAVDFGIQFVGWLVASALKTEKFYDVLGSCAFASTVAMTLGTSGMLPRQRLASDWRWRGRRGWEFFSARGRIGTVGTRDSMV